ncbi:MAG: 50S rRNA methyltransferase, partial [Betaproteobacteria bacterium HGW-Betaproteobacteria-17]
GMNFLRHALFGEDFVEQHPGAYEKRLARKRALAEQNKEAGFQKKMELEDDKYSGEH